MSGLDSRRITSNNKTKQQPVSLRREIQMYQYYNTNVNNCLLVFYWLQYIGHVLQHLYNVHGDFQY